MKLLYAVVGLLWQAWDTTSFQTSNFMLQGKVYKLMVMQVKKIAMDILQP